MVTLDAKSRALLGLYAPPDLIAACDVPIAPPGPDDVTLTPAACATLIRLGVAPEAIDAYFDADSPDQDNAFTTDIAFTTDNESNAFNRGNEDTAIIASLVGEDASSTLTNDKPSRAEQTRAWKAQHPEKQREYRQRWKQRQRGRD